MRVDIPILLFKQSIRSDTILWRHFHYLRKGTLRWLWPTQRQNGIAQTCSLLWKIEKRMLHRTAQINIDKQRIFSSPRHKNSQIGCNSTLPFAWKGTGDNDGAYWLVNAQKADVSAQNAVGFGIRFMSSRPDEVFHLCRVMTPNSCQCWPCQELCKFLGSAYMGIQLLNPQG